MNIVSLNQVKKCSNCSQEARYVLGCCCKACKSCAMVAKSTPSIKGLCLMHKNETEIHDVKNFIKSRDLNTDDKDISIAYLQGKVTGEDIRQATRTKVEVLEEENLALKNLCLSLMEHYRIGVWDILNRELSDAIWEHDRGFLAKHGFQEEVKNKGNQAGNPKQNAYFNLEHLDKFKLTP